MSELVAFPDAEAMAITWLTGKLGTGVGISTGVPNPRPAEFVKVTRTGGVQRDIVYDEAQLTFECWGTDEVAAYMLCRLVRAHFANVAGEIVAGVYVRKVIEIGGPANFPDPESTSPRYQYTAGAVCRGAAI